MKYVIYSLDWQNGIGYQPYEQIASCGVGFEGGIVEYSGRFLGKLIGDDDKCSIAIASCNRFGMNEVTEDEANLFASNGTHPPTLKEDIDALTIIVGILTET